MNPSLLLIPDRYKASKLYSQIPDSGAGDLAFTRANDTATRVNSAGLIEKVRTNIVLQSNSFSTTWVATTSTVASGQAGYDGTNNAWLLTKSAGSGRISQSLSGLSGLTTFSVYAKANASSYIAIGFGSSFIFVNLTNGAQGSVGTGSYKIENVGNGWYRISMTTAVTSSDFNIYPAENNDLAAPSGSIFIQNSQAEAGDIATPYIPTTTAAVSVGPVANIPRIDYTGGGCGKLLLEPQRTNLALFSEQIDNAAWTKVQSSVTANNAASPDGFINADKFIANTTSNLHFANSSIANVAAPWTYSVFAKAAGYDRLIMWVAGTNFVGFNLTTGLVESTLGTGITSANIQNYGNGWYRCSITSTSASSGTSIAFAVFNATFTDGNSNPIFTGNGTDGILIYGAQFEAGSYVSSYIPTLGASVTRSADVALKPGISSLIGQQEGVIYWEGILPSNSEGGSPFAANIVNSDRNINSNSGYTINYVPSSQQIAFSFFIGDGTFAPIVTLVNTLFAPGTYVKIAAAYKSGSSALVVNGGSPAVSSALFTSTTNITALWVNDINVYFAYPTSLKTNAIAFYTTRLSNSELQTLTTL